MTLANVSLDDKYALERGRVFVTGVQALARLPMLQRDRDGAAGLNTAGFVSGYRGSPLGGLDRALVEAKRFLEPRHIRFVPGVNEDLAATSCWGTQQVHLFPEPRYDGVFAMWYGKGPGVDRCGDVFRHANYAGTARHGGVLVVAGDDHAARSSAVAHQTEHIFSACGIPVLVPAGIQEYLDFGLHGWAMSRYAGVWVAMKITSDTVESSAVVDIDPDRVQVRIPEQFELPPDGLHLRWPDPQPAQEYRIQEYKVYAALAYCRANRLNETVFDSAAYGRPARLGIIAGGKAYLDLRQALDDLGIDDALAGEIGLRIFKVGLVWPLEAECVRHFAEGLEEILVVEEKRQIIEYQLKEELYNWREDVRPRVVGKYDERGEWSPQQGKWLLPPTGELTPAIVARAVAARIARFHHSASIGQRLAFLDARERALARPRQTLARLPWFCPGCPHNTSTRVPEGSCALGGVGCHLMAVWMNRSTLTWTHMGGEGATWIGAAAHTGTRHVFANMGDGTYFHSGLLAIRAAVAAGVNITYKLLYNDAVAMTGGQPLDGVLTVPQLTRQLEAEGVRRIVVVTDETRKYAGNADFAPGVRIRPRAELERVQRELREVPGVSALIYDQTCAAEKRRRRKRGAFPDPARRVFINELVCEGCGDCAEKSNCLSVVPVETEFGRKRAIDQSSCNKDFSCLNGYCPSLVTVVGGRLRSGRPAGGGEAALAALPEPVLPAVSDPYGILITGVGGTGVVTIGALLGMAAHLEGKGVTVLDMTGLAQKGGPVMSHVRICERQERLHTPRIATGEANLVLAGDLATTLGDEPLAKIHPGTTRAVANTSAAITGDFIRDPDKDYPEAGMEDALSEAVGRDRLELVDAGRYSAALMGDTIYANLLLLGFAWQKGLVPVGAEALGRAVELNGAAAEANQRAFRWGRLAAHDRAAVERIARPTERVDDARRLSVSLEERIARRCDYLTDYQDAGYAARYRALVERVRLAESRLAAGSARFTDAVARAYFRLLACKDEYEVARLFADPAFARALAERFEGDYRLRFHFTLPFRRDAGAAGAPPRKREFGPWMMTVLKGLKRMKRLRGTRFDPFARGADRELERSLIAEFERTIEVVLAGLRPERIGPAVELVELFGSVRGYGPVKRRNAEAALPRIARLREVFGEADPVRAAAA
jgi:indolepyruvate ferredoxin oxidoreductase